MVMGSSRHRTALTFDIQPLLLERGIDSAVSGIAVSA